MCDNEAVVRFKNPKTKSVSGCAILLCITRITKGDFMETVVTSRIDSDLKDKAVCALSEKGLTASDAIRKMFEQVAMGNETLFADATKPDAQEVRQKIARLDGIYVHGFEGSTDEDLKRMRREERYATVFGH